LQAYGSSKDIDQIGQNGVGIKQVCTGLSDFSIVIIKNVQSFSIGVISKSLQRVDGVCLFSYQFEYATLNRDLDRWLLQDEDFRDSVEIYGGTSATNGRIGLNRHIHALLAEKDEHLFLEILHKINQEDTGVCVSGLLESLATQLPKSYLHIPSTFQITVDSERIQCQYLERRLAELHYFPLMVDPHNSYKVAADWELSRNHHLVHIYIGFDPVRALESGRDTKASLFVYSRGSGRLLNEIEDARGYVNLTSSGTKYA
jgi:hypothetical protein